MTHFRQALDLRPGCFEAASFPAWALATSEASAARGAEAERTAGHAIDLLTAAQAETGAFDEAARTARGAVELVGSQGWEDLVSTIESRPILYKSGGPLRGRLPGSAGGTR